MGKKSKKNAAKTEAGPPSSLANAEEAGAEVAARSGSANGILTSGSGSSKKQRCITCRVLLKDLTKAHECHGCHQLTGGLFCWRCERKYFVECPNGSACAHPVKRCHGCSHGVTAKSISMKYVDQEGNSHWVKGDDSDLFLRVCEREHSKCNMDSIPLQQCGADGCSVQECYRCLAAPDLHQLNSCSICSLVRCYNCMHKKYVSSNEITKEMMRMSDSNTPLSKFDFAEVAEMIRNADPESIGKCEDCGVSFCFSCMDNRSLQIVSRCFVDAVRNGEDGCELFRCSQCYWSSKPCTNPNCPNEVGIPTKRCGGCHLGRYCSVECQAAAYPEHMRRCHKIQAKRAATVEIEKKE